MDDVLAQLTGVRGIAGCLVLSDEGLLVACHLRSGQDEDAIAAAAADLVSNAQMMAEKLGDSNPTFIHVQGDQSGLFLLAAGQGFLGVVTDPHANLALLHLEAQPYTDAIAQRLSL